MAHSAQVVVAGNICFDIFPEMIPGGKSLNEILRPGKYIQVGEAKTSSGGPVSNTSLALNRLGISVELMGKCGTDMFGRALIEKIKEESAGAEKGMQIKDGEMTSYTVVISPPGIDRFFFHCPSINDTFSVDDIDMDIISVAKLFHFGYPPAMARMYKGPLSMIFSKRQAITTFWVKSAVTF